MKSSDHDVDVSRYFKMVRKIWWKVALLSLVVGVITLLVTFQMPDVYRSTAVITPVALEEKTHPALGALATSFGISFGGPSRVEDLESLFRSYYLTIRVFRKSSPWPILLGNRYDPATGNMRPSLKDWLAGEVQGARPPGDWDAIRLARKSMEVSVNKRSGTVSISFESPSAKRSEEIVRNYLEEGKSRLQEEAFERAVQNKKFLEEQIGRTIDPLTRDRLYSLFGQEVEKEMLARNREQFGFRVLDPPLVPDRKSKPQRALISLLATLLAALVWSAIFTLRVKRPTYPQTNGAVSS